jgi:tetratricopeptide (TPR) repeat protein
LEKKQFHILLSNYTCLSTEEAQSLILLEKEFPYSQVISSLAARAAQDNQLIEKEEQLHLAAICVTDRAVFKSIMTAPVQIRTLTENEEFEISTQADAPTLPLSVSLPINTPDITTSKVENTFEESIYEEVIHDLESLHNSMQLFEETVKNLEKGITPNSIKANNKNQKHSAEADDEKSEVKAIEKAKPEVIKQQEQQEIIEQFIKAQPTIKGKVAEQSSVPQGDLTEKNNGYNENIISETLAHILIKQGKKEKAIDILKKLIWKFPQKKAYFAAQIEELKK